MHGGAYGVRIQRIAFLSVVLLGVFLVLGIVPVQNGEGEKVIGSLIRQRHERWARKYVRKVLEKPFFREVITDYHIEKIIKYYVAFNTALLNITFFIVLLMIFLRGVYVRMGFEKTIILLLVIMVFLGRRFLERFGGDGKF